ncbi:nucleotide exchange factor GrpE [Lachnospiraceae bacterium NSJ-143]|nr:nucleotide exchange factor GrpE [Lachnospiraceae bacterium NSJ-143]
MENEKKDLDEEIVDEAANTAGRCEKPDGGETMEESGSKELSEAKAKADEYLDKYQRLMAEFYNFRERTSKEKACMYDDGVRDTVEKLLPVVDNLERAVSAQKEKADEGFIKGVDMILKQFKETLKAMGVEEIPAVGEKFDPQLHAAVSHIEDKNFEENTVSVEMLKGYTHKGKVIRHSMVQVAN